MWGIAHCNCFGFGLTTLEGKQPELAKVMHIVEKSDQTMRNLYYRGSGDGTVVRALPFHQYSHVQFLPGVICKLNL